MFLSQPSHAPGPPASHGRPAPDAHRPTPWLKSGVPAGPAAGATTGRLPLPTTGGSIAAGLPATAALGQSKPLSRPPQSPLGARPLAVLPMGRYEHLMTSMSQSSCAAPAPSTPAPPYQEVSEGTRDALMELTLVCFPRAGNGFGGGVKVAGRWRAALCVRTRLKIFHGVPCGFACGVHVTPPAPVTTLDTHATPTDNAAASRTSVSR